MYFFILKEFSKKGFLGRCNKMQRDIILQKKKVSIKKFFKNVAWNVVYVFFILKESSIKRNLRTSACCF